MFNIHSDGHKAKGVLEVDYDENNNATARTDFTGKRRSEYSLNVDGQVAVRTEYDLNTHKGDLADLDDTTLEIKNSINQNDKKEQGKTQNYVYFGGNLIGEAGDFDITPQDYAGKNAKAATDGEYTTGIKANFQPVSNSVDPYKGATGYFTNDGDTLESISLQLYGDASLWHILAEANGLQGSEKLPKGSYLTVPEAVYAVANKAFIYHLDADAIGEINAPTLTDFSITKSDQVQERQAQTIGIGIEIVALVGAYFSGPYAPLVYAGIKQELNKQAGFQDGYNLQDFAVDATTYYVGAEIGAGGGENIQIGESIARGAAAATINAGIRGAVYEYDKQNGKSKEDRSGSAFSFQSLGVDIAASALTTGFAKELPSTDTKIHVIDAFTRSAKSIALKDLIARAVYDNYDDYKKKQGGSFLFRTLQGGLTNYTNTALATYSPQEQAKPAEKDLYDRATEFFFGAEDMLAQNNQLAALQQQTSQPSGPPEGAPNLSDMQASAYGIEPGAMVDVGAGNILGGIDGVTFDNNMRARLGVETVGLSDSDALSITTDSPDSLAYLETSSNRLSVEGNNQIDAAINSVLAGLENYTSTYDESITSTAVFDDAAAKHSELAQQAASNQVTQAELTAMSSAELTRYASDQNFKAVATGNSSSLIQEYLAAGESLPTGSISAIGPMESYFTFNKSGQFLRGVSEGVKSVPGGVVDLAEQVILTAADPFVAGYKGLAGESDSYNALSKIGQTYQEKGALSGSLNLIGSLVTGLASPIKDFHDGNYQGLGQAVGSAGGGAVLGLGVLKLKHGYDKTTESLDSLSSSFNIDTDRLYQGTNNQIGLTPDVIPSNESIRFSQSSVSSRTGEGLFLLDLTDNIATNGFNPNYPLTTIRLPDDGLTSFDNRRLLSSDAAGVTPFVSIFDFDSPIPQDRFNNFNDRDKISPSSFSDIASQRTFQKDSPISTWGEASILRGINQVAPKGREGIGFDVYGSKDLPVITPTRLDGGTFDTEGARYLESLKSSGVFNGARGVPDKIGDGIRYENYWDDLGQTPASLSNREVRAWYLSNEMEIPNLLDTSKSLEYQAKQAFDIRNDLRAGARDLMSDQKKADYLRMNEANATWDEFITIKSMKYSGDDLWNSIINSSQKSRESVNTQFNFIGERPRYD